MSDLRVVVVHAILGQIAASDDITDLPRISEELEAAKTSGTGFWVRKEDPTRTMYIPSWSVENIQTVTIGKPAPVLQQAQAFPGMQG